MNSDFIDLEAFRQYPKTCVALSSHAPDPPSSNTTTATSLHIRALSQFDSNPDLKEMYMPHKDKPEHWKFSWNRTTRQTRQASPIRTHTQQATIPESKWVERHKDSPVKFITNQIHILNSDLHSHLYSYPHSDSKWCPSPSPSPRLIKSID